MLRSETVTKKTRNLKEIKRLYNTSFPDNERIPWFVLFRQLDEAKVMKAWYDDTLLIGLTYVFLHKNIAYLGYLAVEENLRDRGYGSLILKLLQEELKDYKIVIDIEVVTPEADNYEERRKRKDFYLRSNFVSTGTGYYFYHVDYELLSYGGIVTADEYRDLIIAHWGHRAEKAVFKTI